ncbi:uncharacterized protein K489DRAFT_33066 [Dissoconium aciculare CBS 342.82]|uniref:Uncharacterized protein n=1 Tax=Dissoconium aciculare CBS 342.82 TaxID=1314786 RepID=A0A6J3LXH5_9PEZI|nr:uncharacterized protein K489DRAFT_33066 [Dissoconium aciculare CBS 342.82]KAF1820455.1 hypothetical protein K489DRAFT_33066 [Dissoconium aciculare CBS 342.82]
MLSPLPLWNCLPGLTNLPFTRCSISSDPRVCRNDSKCRQERNLTMPNPIISQRVEMVAFLTRTCSVYDNASVTRSLSSRTPREARVQVNTKILSEKDLGHVQRDEYFELRPAPENALYEPRRHLDIVCQESSQGVRSDPFTLEPFSELVTSRFVQTMRILSSYISISSHLERETPFLFDNLGI